MRRLALLVLLAACKPHDPEPPPPPPSVTVPIDAAPLPDGFPARGAPAVEGSLAGKHFALKKAALRLADAGTSLDLYAWSEGAPCEPQFAPNEDQLYIKLMFAAARAKPGAAIHTAEPGVHAIFRRPTLDPIATDATLVIDQLTATHATGRLLLTAADGSRAAGSFDAVVCASPQQAVSDPAALHGLHWGQTDVEPSALPTQPVTATLLGKPAAPVAIETVDWQGDTFGQHEVHVFLTKPAKPCQFDQMTPGFKIGFRGALAPGNTAKTSLTLVTKTGDPFAAVMWDEPGNVLGLETTGWMSATIDAVTPTEIRGRVFAWFNDASKSMIAGAFTAKRCTIHP